jgi:hypothetical protein
MDKGRIIDRAITLAALIVAITSASTHLRADTGTCGGQMITLPFTDVAGNQFFCQIAEAYFSGLTNGTSGTTYSPSQNVTREQMAAFITRTLDSTLRRGKRKSALNQWALPSYAGNATTDVGNGPQGVKSDGADLWVAANGDGTVSRVRASDGKLLETWTGATDARGVLVARGRIFVTGHTNPGALYRIDPKQPAGDVDVVSSNLGDRPESITTDGNFIWTANSGINGGPGSVSKVNPGTGNVTTFTAGFSRPQGILYDGTNIWVTDGAMDGKTLKKLNSDGTVAQSINAGGDPGNAVFDGANIWVTDSSPTFTVTVVRVKDSQGNPLAEPFVLATLSGNGLDSPFAAAFDGQRILVANLADSVSLWQATDLTPLGSVSVPAGSFPAGACSDGINFWITFVNTRKLARL